MKAKLSIFAWGLIFVDENYLQRSPVEKFAFSQTLNSLRDIHFRFDYPNYFSFLAFITKKTYVFGIRNSQSVLKTWISVRIGESTMNGFTFRALARNVRIFLLIWCCADPRPVTSTFLYFVPTNLTYKKILEK